MKKILLVVLMLCSLGLLMEGCRVGGPAGDYDPHPGNLTYDKTLPLSVWQQVVYDTIVPPRNPMSPGEGLVMAGTLRLCYLSDRSCYCPCVRSFDSAPEPLGYVLYESGEPMRFSHPFLAGLCIGDSVALWGRINPSGRHISIMENDQLMPYVGYYFNVTGIDLLSNMN